MAKVPGTPEPAPGHPDEGVPEQRAGKDRRQAERRKQQVPVPVDRRKGEDRRKGPRRRRNINQYDLGQDELEFINAVNRFKEQVGKRFPTAKDLLQILRDLGYEKRG